MQTEGILTILRVLSTERKHFEVSRNQQQMIFCVGETKQAKRHHKSLEQVIHITL